MTTLGAFLLGVLCGALLLAGVLYLLLCPVVRAINNEPDQQAERG